MDAQAGEIEGKLLCPNKKCGARVGSIKWTGAQCSCKHRSGVVVAVAGSVVVSWIPVVEDGEGRPM